MSIIISEYRKIYSEGRLSRVQFFVSSRAKTRINMGKIENKKVAVLATDGFEQSELEKPVEALRNAGALVEIISLKSGSIKGWAEKDWGDEISVDKTIDSVKAADYDALVLPGGVMNPDTLRMNKGAVGFVSDFMNAGKPVAAICHGPWTLVEAGAVKGRRLTSWPSLRTDIENAGGQWVDEEVVTDNGLVTSRKPADLPAFCKKMIEEIAEGAHG
jgi:protease I